MDRSRAQPRRTAASILSLDGPLADYVAGKSVQNVEDLAPGAEPSEPGADVVLAFRRLQDIADYRAALRAWLAHVAPGGLLIVIVPHAFLYERQLALPSPWRRQQRRLYTPASLLEEVEEALVPNSYRVRLLADLDGGYDYASGPHVEPEGESDVALVIEKIAAPAWSLSAVRPPRTAIVSERGPFEFEPVRTRIEMNAHLPVRRILILKLDHLGDLIMAVPALTRARNYFADAEITLVVGPWNASMARELGVADHVIEFSAFPRNSSEEEPNVEATRDIFRALVPDEYDLAIDLRTDIDTRTLLRAVNAKVKAGIGPRWRFPFLDIPLPLDGTRNEVERAQEDRIAPGAFSSQGSVRRGHFGLRSDPGTVERGYAIIWGPYLRLRPGDYIFDFYLDLDEPRDGAMLRLDIAIGEGKMLAETLISRPGNYHLPFRIEEPDTPFEARIWAVDGRPTIGFSCHGGMLLRQGGNSVLHQSEYSTLLIELVKLRLQDFGMLEAVAPR